jgi:hypothetical protein
MACAAHFGQTLSYCWIGIFLAILAMLVARSEEGVFCFGDFLELAGADLHRQHVFGKCTGANFVTGGQRLRRMGMDNLSCAKQRELR